MMQRFFHQWDTWWCRSCPPHALALFRIAFGCFLLVYAFTYGPHLTMIFSRDGLLLPLHSDWFLASPTPEQVWMLYGALLLGLILITAGLWMRFGIVLTLSLTGIFWNLSLHHFPTSYNRLFLFVLIVLLFSGADRTYSLAMKIRKGSFTAWEPISILPQRLLAVQITALFLGVGWQKVVLPSWQGSEILTYSMIGRWGTPPAFWLVRQHWPIEVWDVIVLLTKLFECTLPFGLWIRPLRVWFLAGMAAFLLSIATLLSIWWFVALIPACILFYDPEEIRTWAEHRSQEWLLLFQKN